MGRTCNRCGVMYESLHTCAHPIHAAVDPLCVYYAGGPPSAVTCDVCRPAREIMETMGGSV